MPNQTFYNLPPQKQEAIEQAAIDEFAAYGFDASNMNRIVAAAKISKGSFYQYFVDKKDLYFHLVDTLTQKKRQHMQPFVDSYRQRTFSENLVQMLDIGLAFSKSDPRLQRLAEDFATKHQAFLSEFIQKYSPETADFYSMLLEDAEAKGQLRTDLDIPVAALLISTLINQTVILLMKQQNMLSVEDVVIQQTIAFIQYAVLKR